MGAHGRYVFGSNVLGTGQIGGGGQSTRLGCAARGLTHTVSPTVLMSALGQKRTWTGTRRMSTLCHKRTSSISVNNFVGNQQEIASNGKPQRFRGL